MCLMNYIKCVQFFHTKKSDMEWGGNWSSQFENCTIETFHFEQFSS